MPWNTTPLDLEFACTRVDQLDLRITGSCVTASLEPAGDGSNDCEHCQVISQVDPNCSPLASRSDVLRYLRWGFRLVTMPLGSSLDMAATVSVSYRMCEISARTEHAGR